MDRIASVRVDASGGTPSPGEATRRLAVALLEGSPRVACAAPGLCRADARGWRRREGGEAELGRRLRDAAREAGFEGIDVGVADAAVAADAAARLAAAGRGAGHPGLEPRGGRAAPLHAPADGVLVVSPGRDTDFLAPLPPGFLPLSKETLEALRTLGVERIGWLADREPAELESRFGPEGLRAVRWARGGDERVFRPRRPDDPPGARLELEAAARSVEPLLFVLRRLLARLCEETAAGGRGVERLEATLELKGGGERTLEASPARPTRREGLLLDLCRAGLERVAGERALAEPVAAVSVAAVERAAPTVHQGDLFADEERDPAAAAAALSRLRARLGETGVVRPRARARHRPEDRSGWEPAEVEEGASGRSDRTRGRAGKGSSPARSADAAPDSVDAAPDGGGSPGPSPAEGDAPEALPGVLRLLVEPRPVAVRLDEAGRPAALREDGVLREVVAAEGPERLSGGGWARPFRREYYRACTAEGELLWLYREPRRGVEDPWRLHGWWD